MAGPNTTGTPNTKDYMVGRGVIYLSALDATTGLPVGGYRDIGDAPELKISVTVQTLDHDSSRHGLKVTDKSITISQKATVSFTMDEINSENLAAFLAGQESAPTNSAIAGFTNVTFAAVGNLALGRWYDLANGSGVRAYDVAAANLSLLLSDNTALVLNTDYTLDQEMGRVFILSTSTTVATGISGNKGAKATVTARAGALAVDQVDGLSQVPQTVALKFIGENAADSDRKCEIQIGSIQLKANGDFNLISDTYTSLGLTGDVQADPNGDFIKIRTVRTS